jgi:tetratricopeptide (TPR) repeat protein
MKSLQIIFVALFVLLTSHPSLQAQTNEEKAKAKATEAITRVDEGKYAEGIKLLEEAQKLDSKNATYPYEIAYAYYIQKDYKKALKYLEPLMKEKAVYENVFQLAGNSYDLLGNKEKALATYDDGLKYFPTSGSLHLERGNMALFKENYEEALGCYEKGIEVAPQFPSNYYWAARIYCSSTEKVWGMIYGEIFMNLERNSKRTGEISKLLYDTYKQNIKFTSDTTMSVSFSKQNQISVEDLQKGALKMPYGMMVYEKNLIVAITKEKQVDLPSINRIRSRFTDFYFQNDDGKEYPNVLFEYQQTIIKAGHFEAYNYWLLGKGEEAAFSAWRIENKTQWESFTKWFNENKLTLNEDHKFYRKQY